MPCTICEPVPVLDELLATTMIPYEAHWFSRPLYELGDAPVPLPQVRIGEPAGRPTGRNSVKPETLIVWTVNVPRLVKRLSVAAPCADAVEATVAETRSPSSSARAVWVSRTMK